MSRVEIDYVEEHAPIYTNQLVDAGTKLLALPVEPSFRPEFTTDGVSITLEGINGVSGLRMLTAHFDPDALHGFGALMGIHAELKQLYPDGATFSYISNKPGVVHYIVMEAETAKIMGYTDEFVPDEMMRLFANVDADILDDAIDTLPAVRTPKVIGAAAMYLADITTRLFVTNEQNTA